MDVPSGRRIYHVQTAEKIPTRAVLRARGTRRARLPARAATTPWSRSPAPWSTWPTPISRSSSTPPRAAISPLLARARRVPLAGAAAAAARTTQQTAVMAANEIRAARSRARRAASHHRLPHHAPGRPEDQRHPQRRRGAVGHPPAARRNARRSDGPAAPHGARQFRRDLGRPRPGDAGHRAPARLDTALYRTMEDACFSKSSPNGLVVPYMLRGATDGAFLRAKGHAGLRRAAVPCARTAKAAPTATTSASRWPTWSAARALLWEIVLALDR